MRVLVTGGRKFALPDEVHRILYGIHSTSPITELGHGDADGADLLCKLWAISFGITVRDYEATKSEWDVWGNRAGNMRNSRMLREFKPELGISFPGGDGTRDMTTKMIEAHITTLVGTYTDITKSRLKWRMFKNGKIHG